MKSRTKGLKMKKIIFNDHIILFEFKKYFHKHIYSDADYKYCVRQYMRVPKNLKFKHPMINDDNQDLCGGWGLFKNTKPDNEIILEKVLMGTKPMGIFYKNSAEEANEIIKEIDKNKFFVEYIKRNNDENWGYEINIATKDKLCNLFDLETLTQDYIDVFSNEFEDFDDDNYKYFTNTIMQYKNYQLCNFFFQWDIDDLPIQIVGLILGFPIENTISIMLEQ